MTAMAVAMTLLLATVGSAAGARAAGMGGHPVAAPPVDSGGAVGRPAEGLAADVAAPASNSQRAPSPSWMLPDGAPETPPQPSQPLRNEAGTAPPLATATIPEGPAPASRPRLAVAVGMGASVDATSSPTGKAFVAPAFTGELGFGDGPVGFAVRLLTSQASGRTADAPPDRLAVDLMLALRPWAARRRDDVRWTARVRRAITIDVGLAAERISAGPVHAYRAGLVVGVRADFPLTGSAAEPGELRLRLALRRMLASETTVGTGKSGDSSELLSALVVSF